MKPTTPPEPTEVTLEQWVHDLRTTDAKQGRSWLCRTNAGEEQFCCIGRLALIGGILVGPNQHGVRHVEDHIVGKLLGSLGDSQRPSWMSPLQQSAAIIANDRLRWTFAKIADWAEAGMPYVLVDGEITPIDPNSEVTA